MPWHWLQAGSHFHHNQRYHWCFPQHMQGRTCERWDRSFFLKNQRTCINLGKLPSCLVVFHQPPLKNMQLSNWIMKPQGLKVKIKTYFEFPPPSMIPTPTSKTNGWKQKQWRWMEDVVPFQKMWISEVKCQFSGV